MNPCRPATTWHACCVVHCSVSLSPSVARLGQVFVVASLITGQNSLLDRKQQQVVSLRLVGCLDGWTSGVGSEGRCRGTIVSLTVVFCCPVGRPCTVNRSYGTLQPAARRQAARQKNTTGD